MNNQIWIDEVDFSDYFQREPSIYSQMLEVLSMSYSRTKEDSKEDRRMHDKARRRKEMENCQHGRLIGDVRWSPGVRPTGERVFYVNVEGLVGGPYFLNEEQHKILHDEHHGHEHISERLRKPY